MTFVGSQCNKVCHIVVSGRPKAGGVDQLNVGTLRGGCLSHDHISSCVMEAVEGTGELTYVNSRCFSTL